MRTASDRMVGDMKPRVMTLKQAEPGVAAVAAAAALGTLMLVLVLSGCSEYDASRGLNPNLQVQGDSAQVFLYSNPPATAEVFAVQENSELVTVTEVQTPQTLVLFRGDYVVHFSRKGYEDALEGVLLGPGSFKEVSVTLDSLSTGTNPQPPTVSIDVNPEEITEGESVSITVSSDGDVGILLPLAIFTTNGTYVDVPERSGTVIYSFAAFRGGLVASVADSVFVHPAPPADPENGQVLVFSNPRSDVEIFDITPQGDLVSTGQTIRTPFTLEREPGPVAFTFREPGYLETTRAVLLGPGQVKEVNVDLLPVGSAPLPPTVELTVEPREVDPGTPVTYTVRTINADFSIFFGQEVVASNESEWTYTTVPDRTRVSSALAFGPGGVASDTTLVVVRTPPGGPGCTTIVIFPEFGPTTQPERQRVTVTEELITIPDHVGPVTLRFRNSYSGDIPGQEDEAFAAGLARGNSIVWAMRPGQSCPVVPDPGFTEETTAWVDAGEVDVPPGNYHVVMWHVATGEFPCYEPVGDLEGRNSVNAEVAEVTYCQ